MPNMIEAGTNPRLPQYVRMQLDNDDILALRNTPVTLIPAVAEQFIVVEEVVIEFYNLVAYTESADNLLIEYANGTAQVDTATVAETVDDTLVAGNATVTVTAAGMVISPKAVTVALATNDSEAVVAGKIRTGLAADADVAAFFSVSGATDKVIITAKVAAANDATMNIAIADGTCVGLAAAANSANTTAGVVGAPIMTVETTGLMDGDTTSDAVVQVAAYTTTFTLPVATAVRIRNSGNGEYGGGSSSNVMNVNIMYRQEATAASA